MTGDEAFEQGRLSGLDGAGLASNPHVITQGSPSRPLGIRWRQGYLAGQREREIAEGELAGDVFFR